MPAEDISTLKVTPSAPPKPDKSRVEPESVKKESAEPEPQQVTLKREIEKVLYEWKAPARPFKRRNRDFWITAIAIAVIVGLILFLVEGFMPVLLVIALVFLFYVMNSVKPEEVAYKITNYGVKFADKLTPWNMMSRFWFTRRFDSKLLVFEANVISGRLELVVDGADEDKITKVLAKYVVHEEAPASYLDKTANWFSKKMPGAAN